MEEIQKQYNVAASELVTILMQLEILEERKAELVALVKDLNKSATLLKANAPQVIPETAK